MKIWSKKKKLLLNVFSNKHEINITNKNLKIYAMPQLSSRICAKPEICVDARISTLLTLLNKEVNASNYKPQKVHYKYME